MIVVGAISSLAPTPAYVYNQLTAEINKMTEWQRSLLGFPNSDFWKRHLICNACSQPLLPPVHLCQNSGHNNQHPLCSECAQCRLPDCTAKAGSTRCILLERILPLVKFSCQFRCSSDPLNFSHYREHTQTCHLRPLTCNLCNDTVDFREYFHHLVFHHGMSEKRKEPSNNHFSFNFAQGQPPIQYATMDNKLLLFRYENAKFWIEVMWEEEGAQNDYYAHVTGVNYPIDGKLKVFDVRSGVELFYSPRSSVFGLQPCVIPAEDEQLCVEIIEETDDNSISSLEYFDTDQQQNESELAIYVHQLVGDVKDLLRKKRASMDTIIIPDSVKLRLKRQSAVMEVDETTALSDPERREDAEVTSPTDPDGGPSELRSSHLVKRMHVLQEIVSTEKAYVLDTGEVIYGYGERAATEDPKVQALLPPQLSRHSFHFDNPDGTSVKEFTFNKFLFGNLEQIYKFHAERFLPKLIASNDSVQLIGSCFIDSYEEFFGLYNEYCQALPTIASLSKEIGEDHEWMECCRQKLHHRLTLNSYLLKPVQRITKYQLLLKDLIKYSEGLEGYPRLLDALDRMLNILRSVDNSMLQHNIVDYPRQLLDEGPLLLQAPFTVWTEQDRLRIAGHPRHLFLYQNSILICKKDRYATNGSLHYKNKIHLDEIGLTENLNVNGSSTRFELWTPGRVKVWLLQAEGPQCKEVWVEAIKKTLMQQLESAKKINTVAK